MNIKTIKIDKGQWLGDVIQQIETNSIYFKTLTGIGATTLELTTPRNSIIVEPNVPVIDGKKGVGIFGVKEGIKTDMVMQFMENKKFLYKKIFVTPESFHKVMEAASNLGINIYEDYFLLFDECDRLVKDVKFRNKVILPMNHFFKFKNKAMISATAIWPSDPRFVKEKFVKQEIVPTFDYKESCKLIGTTNINESLSRFIEKLSAGTEEEKFFIFFNSVKEPQRIISQLKISGESTLFCSKDGAIKLLDKKNLDIHDTVVDVEFKKYNFFTSRFFAAVDMKVSYKPHVILVSNLLTSPHSKIDPESEAKQITGRLRNGVSSVTVISNIDKDMEYFNPEECLSYLKGCKQCFETLKTLHLSATDNGAKVAIEEALSLVSYARYIDENGSKNHYLIDQFIYEEKVKSFYASFDALKKAYCNHYFDVDYTFENFPIMDKHIETLDKAETYKDRAKSITDILCNIESINSEMAFTIDNSLDVYYALKSAYPIIVQAYELLGKEVTNTIAYSETALKRAIMVKQREGQASSYGLIGEIYSEFEIGEKLSGATIKYKLKLILDKLGLDHLKPEVKLLKRYFEFKQRNDIEGPNPKKYNLIRKKLYDSLD